MTALLVGIGLVLVAVYLVLPVSWSPQWLNSVLEFLKGGIPIGALMIGLLAIFIGITDIKDRIEAKKEEEKEKSEESSTEEKEKTE
ncbi:MAG: hypothetical protein N2442_06710 [Spirochaetes bacterium]|nr:hypothetical protein [Spirochaetota bacterium]